VSTELLCVIIVSVYGADDGITCVHRVRRKRKVPVQDSRVSQN